MNEFFRANIQEAGRVVFAQQPKNYISKKKLITL